MGTRLRDAMRQARRNSLTAVGLSLIVVFVLIAILAPWIAPYPRDVSLTHVDQRFSPPNTKHWFGTDELGRDILSRVILGTRISLRTGSIVVALALAIGIPLGLVAGTFGGVLDEVLMRVTDMFLSFPPLLLAMIISATLGPSLENAMIAIAVAWWPWYARLIRSEALAIRERDYVEAARAAGASRRRLLFRHVLPNSVAPVIVQASMDFGSVILTSASLSFIGLGAQPPTPEWGLMINLARTYFLSYWWIATFPGLAILIAVLSFNITGDGLRQILDPKARLR
jgi:peptide/nickel transport system permease protein